VPIRSAAQLRNKVGLTPVGKSMQLTVERDGRSHEVIIDIVPSVDSARKDNGRG
jgi:serine protease Do